MKQKFEKREITKKSEDFSKWYIDVILKSKMADYSPVKGCQVIRPYGFAIWEGIQQALDKEMKKAGIKNAYFPIFIPEKFLKKEKEHVKGFSPELAVVTIGGGKKLKEKLIVRPTSETIIYDMYSKWVKSWRDLPILINQWCNVVRWEKRTRLFLRTTEFLWQEGHTVHRAHKQAFEEVMRALKMYNKIYREFFAIDGLSGKKSEFDKFPGAEETYAYEMLMPDGKALQGCTSHDLGQNFAKAFNIKFLDKDSKEKTAWQTSWGLSTRSIGALIMAHGDDLGLVLPPKLAPIQIIVLPVLTGKKQDEVLIRTADDIRKKLSDLKVEVDKRKEYSLGWKFNEWELKGVPLRIEIGKDEIKKKKLTLVRRDNQQKYQVAFVSAEKEIKKILDSIQRNLFTKSTKHLKENTRQALNYKEFKDTMKSSKGFIRAFWCENQKCEKKIKKETKASTRLLEIDAKEQKGKCVHCLSPAKRKWIFAQAY
ncbi:MAG: proline--tRNA ligase [Patescibacteria group bacterium]|nr:proline--tRNA ligase [Patescibacteria group bacterium]